MYSYPRDEVCRRLYILGFTYQEIAKFMKRTHPAIILAVRRGQKRIETHSR